MLKVVFICLGNICRSPMAEFIFKDFVKANNLQDKFTITSAGTNAEVGSDIYPLAKKELEKNNIFFEKRAAAQFQKNDYAKYDYIIAMEEKNIVALQNIVGTDKQAKLVRLLDFSNYPRDIADPWYTRDFSITYCDIQEGCHAFLQYLQSNHII